MKTISLSIAAFVIIGCGQLDQKTIYRAAECEECTECDDCKSCNNCTECDDCETCETCDCSPTYSCTTTDPYDLQDWCESEENIPIPFPIQAAPCEYTKTDWGSCVTNAPGAIYIDGELFCGDAFEITYCCIWDETRENVIKLYQHLLYDEMNGVEVWTTYEETISEPECNDSVWVFGP